MTVNIAGAVKAYDSVLRQQSVDGMNPRDKVGASDFAGMLREATESAVKTLRDGEAQTLQAAAGAADMNEVVMAVSKAEMTLQTVVAVRDKVVRAYQEILRMPI